MGSLKLHRARVPRISTRRRAFWVVRGQLQLLLTVLCRLQAGAEGATAGDHAGAVSTTAGAGVSRARKRTRRGKKVDAWSHGVRRKPSVLDETRVVLQAACGTAGAPPGTEPSSRDK